MRRTSLGGFGDIPTDRLDLLRPAIGVAAIGALSKCVRQGVEAGFDDRQQGATWLLFEFELYLGGRLVRVIDVRLHGGLGMPAPGQTLLGLDALDGDREG